MFPRKIPNWLLSTLWLGSLIPYLALELWLKRIPALFYGADVIGNLVSNCLLAFFTAFPFWWMIEWFSRRAKRLNIALLQRTFIDSAFNAWNEALSDSVGSGSPESFHLTLSDKLVREKLRVSVGRELDEIMWNAEYGPIFPTVHRIYRTGLSIGALMEMLDPYLADHSYEFNLLRLRLKGQITFLRELERKDNPVDLMITQFLRIRSSLLMLELRYRIEHSLDPVALPDLDQKLPLDIT